MVGTLDSPTPYFVHAFTSIPSAPFVTFPDALLVVPKLSYMSFTSSLQNSNVLRLIPMLLNSTRSDISVLVDHSLTYAYDRWLGLWWPPLWHFICSLKLAPAKDELIAPNKPGNR